MDWTGLGWAGLGRAGLDWTQSLRPATIFVVATAKEDPGCMPHRRRFVLPLGSAASLFLRSVSHPPSAFHRLGHHSYPPYLTLSTQSKGQIRIWRAEHKRNGREGPYVSERAPSCVATCPESPHSALIHPPTVLLQMESRPTCPSVSAHLIRTDRCGPGIPARPPRTNRSASVR